MAAFTTGVRNLVITPVNVDSVSAYTLGTAIPVIGVRQANWNMNIESFDHRGDDALLHISQQIDKLTIEFELAGFSLDMLAAVTGGTYCADALETLAGTISSVGTAVTGTTTVFDEVLRVGDTIMADDQEAVVASIASATALTLVAAFTADVTATKAHVILGNRFTHDVQAVSDYHKIQFQALMVDSAMFEVTVAKAKVTSGPSGNHADKTPGVTTMQATGVKVLHPTTKAFSMVQSSRPVA